MCNIESNTSNVDQTDDWITRRAATAAEFAKEFLFKQHRGVIDCDDHFVVFGNDGYDDPRSRREAELVIEALHDAKPVLGVSADGYTWAVVVTDYQRPTFDPERLSRIVRKAWETACNEIGTKESKSTD